MGRRISFVVLVIALIFALSVFSYAVDPPEGSEILEYIESSGTQYIDSLFKPNTNTRVKMRAQLLDNNLSSLFGYFTSSTSQFAIVYNNTWQSWYGSGALSLPSFSYGGLYSFELSKNGFVIDSTSSGAGSGSFTSSYSAYLFALNLNGSANYISSARVYDSEIYDNGTLVRDYVPLRMTDSRVGLWDYVDGTFYPNVGTGSFIAGPVIEVIEPENPEYSITVQTEGSGTASASASKSIAGETITLTATPSDGFIFSGWEVVSGDVSISNNQFVMPAEDVVIKATFTDDPNIFSITVSSDGNGTASSSVSAAEQGATISLTASPNPGYKLKQWNVLSGGVSISNDSFTMPAADVEIQAVFEPIIYTITVAQSPNGTASASADTGIIGDTIYLTVTPAKGYVLNYWEFTPAIVTATDNQFIMPAANITVKPVFIEQSAISSGFTYNSGIISGETRSDFGLCDFSFGEQIAGKYIINIYHWGDSYDVNFYIYDSNEKYYPVTTAGGCSTFIYNHSGGTMAFDGAFSLVNNNTSYVEGNIHGSGYSDPSWVSGDLEADGPLSWTFNIENIVAVPLEIAQDSDFGTYSLIVGFLRDQFNSLKAFFAARDDKEEESYTGATSPELSQDINSASSMIEQEQQFMEDINIQITDQSSKVDPVTVLDGIDGSGDVFNSMLWVSSIVSTGIDNMGVFQFVIYVPMILGIVTLVIGRGSSIAGRRPRLQPRPINMKKGK